MTTYYKATAPSGRDFRTGTIDYAAALASGEVIRHPSKRKVRGDASTYLSVSVEPANCTGFAWPCRLFRVEPVGRVGTAPGLPNKRTTRALRVVEELPAHLALGPNGEAVAAFIERCKTLTPEQVKSLSVAWSAALAAARRDAAWSAALAAALAAARRDAARSAARSEARDAAWSAALAAARRDAARSAARSEARDAAWSAALAAARRDAAGSEAWSAALDAALDAVGSAAGSIVTRDLITDEQYRILTQPFRDAGLEEWVA